MQRLFQVELPTAAPVIIAGIRTSTVWVIGTATLSTPVGATSLGNYIFSGLQTQNQTAVLVGCVAAALLAIVLDQLIHTFELAYRKRSRPLGLIAGAILVVFIFAGTYPALSEKASAAATQEENIIVGAKPFTEQYILADLISELLTENDIPVENRSSLGSTVLFNALRDNLVDCYVDYTGTIWANVMKRDDIRPPAEVLDEMNVWLKDTYGIVDLGPLGFENTYALAIKRSLADSLNIRSIADLSLYAPNLRIGSDYEFFSRPEWKALEKNYGLGFAREISLDPSLMYEAIDQGQVDVISAYSTDGRIVDYDLAVLTDPSHVLPPYDAVLLLSPEAAENIAITGTLGRLIGSISDREMRLANKLVDVDGLPVDSAAAFLRNLVD
jgi:osmoprotectant transport system permease protein